MPLPAVPRSALRVLALRALVLWTLVHALTAAVLAMARDPEPLAPNPVWVMVVSIALLLADVRRRGERALWGNLGVSTTQLVLLAAVVYVAGESLLAFARR